MLSVLLPELIMVMSIPMRPTGSFTPAFAVTVVTLLKKLVNCVAFACELVPAAETAPFAEPANGVHTGDADVPEFM